MRSVNMYFATNPTFFATDEAKILATLSYMEGVVIVIVALFCFHHPYH